MSAIMIASYLFSWIIVDRLGRKIIILVKISLLILTLSALISVGFIIQTPHITYAVLFLLSIMFGTFTMDLMMFGFESLPKDRRDNYVIILSSTKIVGAGITCGLYYYLGKWQYFYAIVTGLLIIMTLLFVKFTVETPYY